MGFEAQEQALRDRVQAVRRGRAIDECAKEIGIHPYTLGGWVRGSRTSYTHTLDKILAWVEIQEKDMRHEQHA